MAVTITVDIGTSIIPVPLPDAAIAYAVSYNKDRNTAYIDIRMYTKADAKAKQTPFMAFDTLVTSEPNTWEPTYSNLRSILRFRDDAVAPDEDKLLRLVLKFDYSSYSWAIDRTTDKQAEVEQWIASIAQQQTRPAPAAARRKLPPNGS